MLHMGALGFADVTIDIASRLEEAGVSVAHAVVRAKRPVSLPVSSWCRTRMPVKFAACMLVTTVMDHRVEEKPHTVSAINWTHHGSKSTCCQLFLTRGQSANQLPARTREMGSSGDGVDLGLEIFTRQACVTHVAQATLARTG